MKMRTVSGFTLIELVVVIAILAILAVIAVPRVVDLRQNAVNSTTAGIAGAVASGSAINYATRVAQGTNTNTTVVSQCGHAGRVLTSGVLPAGATIVTPATAVTVGASTQCAVNYTNGGLSAVVSFDLVGSN